MTQKNDGPYNEPTQRELAADNEQLRRELAKARDEVLNTKIESVARDVASLDRLNATVAAAQKTAVEAALAAQEKLTAAAFAASKEAIAKSDESQRAYNSSHNDLLRKMDDQHKETLPRPEASEKFKTLDDKIDGPNGIANRLTTIESRTAGIASGASMSHMNNQTVFAYIIGAVGAFVGVATLIIYAFSHTVPK